MSDYIYHRDLLDDEYYSPEAIAPSKIWPPEPIHKLSSKVFNKPVSISALAKMRPVCHHLEHLIMVYLESHPCQHTATEINDMRNDFEKVHAIIYSRREDYFNI